MISKDHPRAASEAKCAFQSAELGDCIELIIDHRGKTPKKLGGDWTNHGVKVVSAKNVNGGKLVNEDSLRHVSYDMYKKWMKEDVRRGDCLLVSEGATLGDCMYWDYDFPVVLSQRIFCIRTKPDVLDQKYFYAYMKTMRFQSEIIGRATGSSVPGLRQTELLKMEVRLLPIERQRSVGRLLYDLDKKIELNRKQNRTLEAIAQALFKHWFVDFEFPDQNGRPYKSRGGAMQPSELGEIPMGWSIKPIDQVANFLNGLALQKFPPESDTEYLPVIKIRELKQGLSANSDRASTMLALKYIVDDGDVLFSWSGSLEVDVWCGGKGALNQHLFKVTSPEYPKWFYFLWTKHHLREFQAVAASKATTMGHIQRSHLSNALTVVPARDQLQEMNTVFQPLLEKFILNRIETRTLSNIRDTLLPKLMSGELRVA